MNAFFNIADYNTPLPEAGIFIDTSFLYEVYGRRQRYTDDCYNFLNRLAANAVPMIITPRVIEELQHIIRRGCTNRKDAIDEINRVIGLINGNPNILNIPFEYNFETNIMVARTMKEFDLDTADALHVVCALNLGINSFATIDSDFWNVANVNIYAPNVKSTAGLVIDYDRNNYLFLYSENN